MKKSDIFVALSLTVLDIETPAGKPAGVFYCAPYWPPIAQSVIPAEAGI